jgi:ligand-binding sensor domain-containing protein
MKRRLALVVMLLWARAASFSQIETVQITPAGGTYKINKYVDEPGFAGSVSEYVFQDSKGYVWGCTRSGLNRLDGGDIVNYTTQDGLVNDTPRCIAEDDKGNIWIGTIDGLSIYNGRSFLNLGTDQGLSHEQVWSLLPCKEGGMLVGTTFGIDRIYNGKIEPYYCHDTVQSVNTI